MSGDPNFVSITATDETTGSLSRSISEDTVSTEADAAPGMGITDAIVPIPSILAAEHAAAVAEAPSANVNATDDDESEEDGDDDDDEDDEDDEDDDDDPSDLASILRRAGVETRGPVIPPTAAKKTATRRPTGPPPTQPPKKGVTKGTSAGAAASTKTGSSQTPAKKS